VVDRKGEGLTDKQRKSLLRYLGGITAYLGLTEWEVRLADEPCEDPSHAATVQCVPGRKIATIQLAADWFTQSPAQQRHVLIHELIHIHTDQEFQYIEDSLPEMIGSMAYFPWEKAYRNLHEHATDALAKALAEHFPVPLG
jgi:hypothetical protein